MRSMCWGVGAVIGWAVSVSACGGDGDVTRDTDVAADSATVDSSVSLDPDTSSEDVAVDATVPEDVAVDTGPERVWRYRAIGGMSMGAAAISIALEHPDAFDVVGALGGYPDLTYMMAQMLRTHFGGFCPLATLEQHLDELDDASASSPVVCGTGLTNSPLEHAQDFNHLFYDDNGITMTRGFYADVIDNFSSAYGNLATSTHADSRLFPAGVDLDWVASTSDFDRCADAKPIDPQFAKNAEYNPDGTYPVIPVCEISRPSDTSLPPSWSDPGTPLTHPVQALLAVDLNANGRRDFGEPLFLNPWERYEDTGTKPDDRFDWETNPDGTAANDRYDDGEPFLDYGLDGVPGTGDFGEGNGKWDAVAAFDGLLAHDADTLLRNVDAENLAAMDFWFDAGIRDALNASVVARNLVAALRSRDREVTVYHGFAGKPGTLLPDAAEGDYLSAAFAADLSGATIGRDVYIEYGDPNATPAMIANGDGKHVGTNTDALNRIISFLAVVFNRHPGADYTPAPMGDSMWTTFRSDALGGRRGYTIGLPPGYGDPDNATRRYPVLFFLHGLGQDSNDLGPALIATSLLMSEGLAPKSIIVFPDGACCFVDRETNQRECACQDAKDGVRMCIDPACEGMHQSCEKRPIPDNRLERECQLSSLFADMKADRWGRPTAHMGYASSVMELVRHVDRTYRTLATPLD